MSRVSRSLIAVAICLVLGGNFAMPATSSAESGSVIITAVIAPVRYIVVDNSGKITEITSNTQANVTPVVDKGRMGGQTVPLTPAIRGQYAAILDHTDTRKTGVIYRPKDNTGKKTAGLSRRINLVSYLPLLFN